MDEYRSGSPVSMPDHAMNDYQESKSMPNLNQDMDTEETEDVTMSDMADGFYHQAVSDSSP